MGTAVVTEYNSWKIERPEGMHSTDVVIDAYITGKKDGLQLAQKTAIAQLKKNIEKAGDQTKKLLDHMESIGFSAVDAYLRIISIDNLEVLVAVKQDDFLNDKFLDVYNWLAALEEVAREEIFNISFSYIDLSENFDEQIVFSDGFIHKFKK